MYCLLCYLLLCFLQYYLLYYLLLTNYLLYYLCLCYLLLYCLLLLVHHGLYHFGQDMLSYLVSLKDLLLLLILPHQAADQESLLLTLLDERVDVLRHLLGRHTSLVNVLLVVEQNPPDLSEGVLVLLGLSSQSVDCR